MKFKQAWKLVKRAIEEDNRDKLYQLYLVDRKHSLYLLANGIIKQKDIPTFNEYCKQLTTSINEFDTRSQDEIMQDILGLKHE